MTKNKVHLAYYTLTLLAWVFLFGDLARRFFPDDILIEIVSLICGFSVGFCIALLSSFIVNRLKAQKP